MWYVDCRYPLGFHSEDANVGLWLYNLTLYLRLYTESVHVMKKGIYTQILLNVLVKSW